MGVCNGAMVLHDSLFADMTFDKLNEVLRPKIDGTNCLDEIFYDTKLDFFVLFSSVSSVLGNIGQSNYGAACQYMTSLVRQRRARGLAASSVDIGRIAGVGYVERVSDNILNVLDKYGVMPLSESEFHHMFAETVLAGLPESGLDPVVSTGIPFLRDDAEFMPHWILNPRFCHWILSTKNAAKGAGAGQATQPAREKLAIASTKEEALDIVKECFMSKLQVLLQLSEQQRDMNVPLIELGIDSLVAVEVRSWFLKELRVDIPVLKILGGNTLSELAEQALEKIPEDMLPALGGNGKGVVAKTKVKTESLSPKRPMVSRAASSSQTIPENAWTLTASPDSLAVSVPAKRPALTSRAHSSALASTVSVATRSSSSDSVIASLPTSTIPSSKPSMSQLKPLDKDVKTPAALTAVKSVPMSLSHSRFWLLDLLLEDKTTSNVAFQYRITGELRIGSLERALKLVTARHEALRTSFTVDEEDPNSANQNIHDALTFKLEHRRIQNFDEVTDEYSKLRTHVFDLSSPELLRVVVLSLGAKSHYMLLGYHHMIMDGASLQILLADIETAYNGRPLGPPPRQFADFASGQQDALENGSMSSELAYWRQVFDDAPSTLPLLPVAKISARVPMKAFENNEAYFRLDASVGAKVKEIAKATRSTPFHVYLATFKTMLARFTESEDLMIGIADAARNDGDLVSTIGLFLNLLAVRFKHQHGQTFRDSVVEARTKVYSALGNSRLPFDVLLKELHHVPRSSAHAPFFQVFFDYRQGVQETQKFGDCELHMETCCTGRTAYDISVDIVDDASGPVVILQTQKSLYDLTATKLLLDTFVNLLDVFVKNPLLTLEETPLFGESQLKRALEVGKGPRLDSDWPSTLSHQIDKVAAENSSRPAVIDEAGTVLTYSKLMHRMGEIAEVLQQQGIQAGAKIVVFQQPTADWVCSLLAIMRLGCVYVPLDIRNPIARLATVTKDCQPAAIIADESTIADAQKIIVGSAAVLDVGAIQLKSVSLAPNMARPKSTAAILYTSGSTGNPKGILIKHESLRNQIEGSVKTFTVEAEHVLQQSTLTFDLSLEQFFTPLTTGGSVYMVPMNKRGDPLEITKIVKSSGITYTVATPSELNLWLHYGMDNLRQATKWRFAISIGEKLTSTVTKQFADLNSKGLRLINEYGPAEITIGSNRFEVDYQGDKFADSIPCGRQLPNYTVYILDENLRSVPTGMPGEIVIGGAGVAAGYLNNDKLTKSQFVQNPWASAEYVANGWTNMYRTGDCGYFTEDGLLMYRHRISADTQVKIRGLRIELGDVESNIIRAADGRLSQAVVTVRGEDSGFLAAHVVFDTNYEVEDKITFLQGLLRSLPLPDYMIPALAVPVTHLPLNNHSKVDRKALGAMPLPMPLIQRPSASGQEMTTTMIQLSRLWQDVLGKGHPGLEISASTSFFAAGGNSLLLVRLQPQIRAALNIVVPLFELMSNNTLGEMAGKIEESLTVDEIDWDRETAIPQIMQQPLGSYRVNSFRPKVVVVTGATGFLGRQLLRRLDQDPEIAQIHCIAVRDRPADSERNISVTSSKVTVHTGDITRPALGLSEATFEMLKAEADAIVHLAAVRSFFESYHLLRSSNVGSTKEIVELAAARRIPIHFVSTAGVLPANVSEVSNAGSVADRRPASDGSAGYVATKWACEQILEKASLTLGIPVSIHRFVPAAEATRTDGRPVLEGFADFIERSKLVPDFSGWKGQLDLMPVRDTIRALYGAMTDGFPSTVRFLNHSCNFRLQDTELKGFLAGLQDRPDLTSMNILQWVGRIKLDSKFSFFFASQHATVHSTEGGRQDFLETRR